MSVRKALLAFTISFTGSVTSLVAAGPMDEDPTYAQNLRAMTEQKKSGVPLVIGGSPTTGFLDVPAVRGSGGLCSGTLVAADRVLTAAHCVCNGHDREIIFGASATGAQPILVIRREKMTASCSDTPGQDIALLWLEKPAPAGVKPRPVSRFPDLEKSISVHIVGFGIHDLSRGATGSKYEADIPIASHRCLRSGDRSNYGCVETTELVGGRTELPPKDTCDGDSGGPLHLRRGSEFALVGVTSRRVRNSTRPCGDGGIYVLLDGARLQWLEQFGIVAQ